METWNLEHIYPFKETEQLLAQLKSKTDAFQAVRKQLVTVTPDQFMDLIHQLEELHILSSKIGGYAHLWLSENTADSKRNAHFAKISDQLTAIGNETIFFTLWFKGLEESKAQEFITVSDKYKYFLESIRRFKDHSLSEKEEKVANLLNVAGNDAIVNMYDLVTNRFRFEWDGKKVPQPEVTKHYSDPKQELREKAYRAVLKKYKDEEAVLGEIYKTIVRGWRNEYLSLRNYKDPIDVRNKRNNVPNEAIQALLDVVRENIGLFQEYFKLKAQILNIPHDRFHVYAPYKHQAKKYPYEEGKKMCLEAYKGFDEKAFTLAKQIFDEGHVHAAKTENKQSGAFCATILNTITPYILLNYVERIEDVFTMMHEFGHGIHGLLAQHQTPFTFHSALPLAETASIFGELILLKKLLKSASDEEKQYLLAKQLDKQYASIVRQAYFVIFEMAAHEKIKDGCTIEELNALYRENLKEQFGDMEINELFDHEWKYIPHIHHTPFYCYAYAFGNLLVLALYKQYEEEGESFVPKYLKLLSYGGSAAPEDILKEIGVDIRSKDFWRQGFGIIKEQLELLKKTIN